MRKNKMTKEDNKIRTASILSLISGIIILVLALFDVRFDDFIQDRMLSISLFFISGIVVTLSALTLLTKKEPNKTFGILIIVFSSLSLLGFGFHPYFDTGFFVLIIICVILGVIGGLIALQIKK
jgi:hypothetical protein